MPGTEPIGPPPPVEPVEPLAAADPAGAVLAAYAAGHRLRLPTSGTTGAPRTVVRTAASWGDSFGPAADLAGLDAGSRAHVPGPLTATMNLYAAALVRHVGGRLVAAEQQATHVFTTPAGLGALGPGAGRRVVVAGDRLDPGAARRAAGRGWRVEHYYGAAELSFVAWGGDADSLRPFPAVDVDVRGGTIWVRSPWVAEQGAFARDGDWATVGDRGRLTPDGGLVVTGRPGAVVTGGATVLVGDVEAVLPGVVVTGRPHAALGAVVVALCPAGVDVAALRRAARTVLPPSHRPRDWVVVDRLPLTGAGKVDRGAVAALAAR